MDKRNISGVKYAPWQLVRCQIRGRDTDGSPFLATAHLVSSHAAPGAKLCAVVCNHYSCDSVLVRVHAVLACEQPRS